MPAKFDLQKDSNATVTINVGNKLSFKLACQDGSYKTSPDPIVTYGIGALPAGTYVFSGDTSYSSWQGGLDQTTTCEAVILSNSLTVNFFDVQRNALGTFRGISANFAPGNRYKGEGSCNWVTAGSALSTTSGGGQLFDKSSDTKGSIVVNVGNKLDFNLVFGDQSYKTSPELINTTGIGAITSGTYEVNGTTSYAIKQGGLDQTIKCKAVIMSNTVTISFIDAGSNPVATFQGNSSTLVPGSKYEGNGTCNWIKN